MLSITVIGTGYVGLVAAACLAETGNRVLALDVDAAKIARLRAGEVPIHEPGLAALVARNAAAGRLSFTTDIAQAVGHATLLLIGVGTPEGEDGSADLHHVLDAARAIGSHLDGHGGFKVIVDKSTVPVGTADRVHDTVGAELARRGVAADFAVVSNPEFLREGAAVRDFMQPDRVIVGSDDPRALALMRRLYAPFNGTRERLMAMDVRSAEFTKYAANAMLAARISLINELALLAERVGADIESVRRGIGSDPRIGASFLQPGAGYGGSCFPKDVRALIRTGHEHGLELGLLAAVERTNERQKRLLVERIVARFGADLRGRRFAVWGLAFKPDTDDMREAPSGVLVPELVRRGAAVQAHDPAAMPRARRLFARLPGVSFAADPEAALDDADALVILTEWRAFQCPDFEAIRTRLRRPLVFDGRNLFDPRELRSRGIELVSIGRTLQAESGDRRRRPEGGLPGGQDAGSAEEEALSEN